MQHRVAVYEDRERIAEFSFNPDALPTHAEIEKVRVDLYNIQEQLP